MQKYQEIATELDDGILTVTLNRPDKLNAYTFGMGKELRDAFERASENDDERAVIVTGAGRGFCAGADISAGSDDFAKRSARYAKEKETRVENRFVDAIFNCNKPSIAAII